jgi:hypothetical protein
VRLVRTVELLLYPPTADSPNDWYSEEWPLSSHIKFPAIGRPQKIYNVSLALRALEQAGGNKGGVSASDVVDGYRERTVGLLLEMMQRWGFGSLVNFEETRKEVERLERKLSKTHTAVEEDEAYAEATLLKRWAAAVAELHGLSRKVENLTTSFADGSVFLAIVAEYEQYFPTRHTKSVEETLEKKLRALGCNSYFGKCYSAVNYSADMLMMYYSWYVWEADEIRSSIRQGIRCWSPYIPVFQIACRFFQRKGQSPPCPCLLYFSNI